jgi:hypothetical protein
MNIEPGVSSSSRLLLFGDLVSPVHRHKESEEGQLSSRIFHGNLGCST